MFAIHNLLRKVSMLVMAVSLFACVASARATILTFDIDSTSTGLPVANSINVAAVYGDYGDNVNSLSTPGMAANTTFNYLQGNGFTPNVVTSYAATVNNEIHTWNGGSWGQAVYRAGGVSNGSSYFTFTPSSLYDVKINSFSLQMYNVGGIASSGTWDIRKDVIGGTSLLNGTWSLPNTNTTLMTFNTSAAGFYTGPLVLEITQTAGGANANGYAGIDNINFDQQLTPVAPAPEPSSWLLLSLGLVGLRTVRRRV
jgi:hypothetical protein